MSDQINDRKQPAFPSGKSETPGYENSLPYYEGFTRQEYAAIHLKQPTSGTPWLDEMILAAKRDELAGQAFVGHMADSDSEFSFVWENSKGERRYLGYGATPGAKDVEGWHIVKTPNQAMAESMFAKADAMLAARREQP